LVSTIRQVIWQSPCKVYARSCYRLLLWGGWYAADRQRCCVKSKKRWYYNLSMRRAQQVFKWIPRLCDNIWLDMTYKVRMIGRYLVLKPEFPCLLCGIRDSHGVNPGKDPNTMDGCYMWFENKSPQPTHSCKLVQETKRYGSLA